MQAVWVMWAKGCCLPTNALTRKGAGWGWFPGSSPVTGNLWSGWSEVPGRHGVEQANLTISTGQCSFRIGRVVGEFNTGKMVPTYRLPRSGANKGTVVTLPPALAPAPYNSVFLHISLAPPELLTICQFPGWVSESKWVCVCAIKKDVWFFRSLLLHPDDQNTHWFLVTFCGNSSFQDFNPGLGSQCMGLGHLIPSGGGGIRSTTLPSSGQPPSTGVGPDRFTSLPLLNSMWLFPNILRYMCYDQLDFRWFYNLSVS